MNSANDFCSLKIVYWATGFSGCELARSVCECEIDPLTLLRQTLRVALMVVVFELPSEKKPGLGSCCKVKFWGFFFTSKGRECLTDSELRSRQQAFQYLHWETMCGMPQFMDQGPPSESRCLPTAVFLETNDCRQKLPTDEPKIKLMALLDILFMKFNFLMCIYITLGMSL